MNFSRNTRILHFSQNSFSHVHLSRKKKKIKETPEERGSFWQFRYFFPHFLWLFGIISKSQVVKTVLISLERWAAIERKWKEKQACLKPVTYCNSAFGDFLVIFLWSVWNDYSKESYSRYSSWDKNFVFACMPFCLWFSAFKAPLSLLLSFRKDLHTFHWCFSYL